MLALLAVEGPTPRSRLAGLLWPEVAEATARNNLSQAFRRLRVASGLAPTATGDRLALPATLRVDAGDLEVALFEGRHQDAARPGELLGGIDYDDLPEFADWLLAQRERLGGVRRRALAAAAERLEALGEFEAAAEWAGRLVDSDNLSEAAYRQLMRLRYLAGDRTGALAAFQAFRDTLTRELGVEPAAETLALVAEMRRGELSPSREPRSRPIPLTVQRPPKLAGREHEWVRLEAAWESRAITFVSGAAGVGKSRLVQEFVASRPSGETLASRPGDALVPYWFLAAAWRRILARFPGLEVNSWVRSELARFLPGDASREAPPLASEADRLRLLDAVAAAGAALGEHLAVIAIDDLHHLDAASLEGILYLLSRAPDRPRQGPHLIATFRTEEAGEALRQGVTRLVESGLAVHLEVGPLDPAGTRELLDSLGLPEVLRLDQQLARFTGGNPLFITETLKNLYQSGAIAQPTPHRLPVSGRVQALLERRLDRLSEAAGRLVTARAVAMSEGGLDLLARLLDTNPLDLEPALRELAAAHVLVNGAFTHELLFEVARDRVPAGVAAHLHARTADCLAGSGASPARVAHHYLQAGLAARAAPFLLAAGETAEKSFRPAEAADLYEQAATLLEDLADSASAFAAGTALARVLSAFDAGDRHAGVVAALRRLARTSPQRVQAHLAAAVLGAMRGDAASVLEETALGLAEEAAAGGEPRAELLNLQGVGLRRRGDLEDAGAALRAALQIIEPKETSPLLPAVLNNLALVESELDRPHEAMPVFRRAAELQKDPATRARVLANLALALAETGQLRVALGELERARAMLAPTAGGRTAELMVRLSTASFQRHLGDYAPALAGVRTVRAAAEQIRHWRRVDLDRQEAAILTDLGALDEAADLLDRILADPQASMVDRGLAWVGRARLSASRGEDPGAALQAAGRELAATRERRAWRRLELCAAELAEPAPGVRLAADLIVAATPAGLAPTMLAAHTVAARGSLALGLLDLARKHASEAVRLLETSDPLDFYRPLVPFTAYQVLDAVGEEAALEHLRAAAGWVLDRAGNAVPEEYRCSFRESNPVNRRILQAARETGVIAPPTPAG